MPLRVAAHARHKRMHRAATYPLGPFDGTRLGGGELIIGERKRREVAARARVHNEDEVARILEGVCEVDNEGMVELGLKLLLERDDRLPVLALKRLHQVLLLHHLHRVRLAAIALDNLEHLAEAALAEDFGRLELLHPRHRLLLEDEGDDVVVMRRREEGRQARRVDGVDDEGLGCVKELAHLRWMSMKVHALGAGTHLALEGREGVVSEDADGLRRGACKELGKAPLDEGMEGPRVRLGAQRSQVGYEL